jgi:hypothetical protein
LQTAHCGKGQLAAGYNIGLGPHGSEACAAFMLKSPAPEPVEFKPPPTPNPFKPEPSKPKAVVAPNAFKPVPSNPKPRRPKAPKFSAKPNKSGTKDKSSPPKEFPPWKEGPPRSNWCASPNREVPKRAALELVREWENEEWRNEELPNREFPRFEVPLLRSKKEVDLTAFAEENSPWPDQLREVDAALGGRFELEEDFDRGALAMDDWPCPDQFLGADTAVGGRFELKEVAALDVAVQED